MHHHVPPAGGFLRRRDAACFADGLHLRGLLLLGTQFVQAEIQRPADLLGVAAPRPAAQSVQRRHQQLTGGLGIFQRLFVFLGGFALAETPGAFFKWFPPRRRIGRPGVGIVFQRTDLRFGQAAQASLGKNGQVFGQVRAPQQCQQRPHRRGRGAELRGGRLIAIERDVRHAELVPDGSAVVCDVAADHRHFAAAHPLPHQAADGGGGAAGFVLPAGGGKQTHLRRGGQRSAFSAFQQSGHSGKAGSIPVPQIAAQQFRRGYFGSAPARQLTQLHGHLLCAGK